MQTVMTTCELKYRKTKTVTEQIKEYGTNRPSKHRRMFIHKGKCIVRKSLFRCPFSSNSGFRLRLMVKTLDFMKKGI